MSPVRTRQVGYFLLSHLAEDSPLVFSSHVMVLDSYENVVSVESVSQAHPTFSSRSRAIDVHTDPSSPYPIVICKWYFGDYDRDRLIKRTPRAWAYTKLRKTKVRLAKN